MKTLNSVSPVSAQHTPGPWSIYEENKYLRIFAGKPHKPAAGTVPICGFEGMAYRDRNETEANARLIAAAPELLAAVLAAINCGSYITDDCAATLVAAYAKAKGGAL
jgi:hypothetical protein